MRRAADALRRAVDLAVALLGLVLLAPVIGAVAIVVWLTLGAPIVFRQRRLGRGGAPFTMYKFRTMRAASPGRDGPEFDQERLGAVGRLLRSTSFDELPSLVNLLRGDITLVGPRPLPVHYWPRFTPAQRRRFEVKPGITGLAQVEGRNTVDWPQRLLLDVRYVEQRSARLDLQILARTLPVVLSGAGVDHRSGVTMHELPPQDDGAATEAPPCLGCTEASDRRPRRLPWPRRRSVTS